MDRFDTLTLRERVYHYLRQEILSGRAAPGSLLQEVPLAESLGVSRGPIREALGSLAAEGLVTITPRRGAVVTSLSKRDFLEVYEVREALEALAVRLAVPGMGHDQLLQLEAHIERMVECALQGDADSFFSANSAFHEAFVVASGNRKLIEVYRRLIGQMGPYRRPSAVLRGSLERSIAEHCAIMAAARAHDVGAAEALVLEHIQVPQRRLHALTEEEFARETRAIGTEAAVPGVAS